MKQKKLDIAVLLLCIIVGAVGIWYGKSRVEESGDRIVIRQAGKMIGLYSLHKDYEIIIDNDYGTNKVVVQEGQVHVVEANCRDQFCVKHNPISRNREKIVCLPNKLIIEVIRLGDEEVDMIVD